MQPAATIALTPTAPRGQTPRIQIVQRFSLVVRYLHFGSEALM
jgi:hypothetical protein